MQSSISDIKRYDNSDSEKVLSPYIQVGVKVIFAAMKILRLKSFILMIQVMLVRP